MAFLPENEKDKEDELLTGSREQPVLQDSGGLLGSGSSSTGDAQAGSGSEPTEGGSQTNVRTYSQRNQPAVGRLANRVGQSVRDRGQTARDTLQRQTGEFDRAVGEAETRDDAGLRNQVLADPGSIARDSDQTARFKAMRDAEYKGPTAFEDTDYYQPVSDAYREANQARERLGTSGGRQELIIGTSRPGQRVSKGRALLDEALLSSDQNARMTLRDAGDSLSDLDQKLADASAAAQARARQGAETTAATRQATRDSLGQARSMFETGLESRLAEARAEANRRADAARKAIGGGGFTYGLDKNGNLVDTTGWLAGTDYGTGFRDLSDEQIARTGLSRQELANRLQSGQAGPGTAFKEGRPGGSIDEYLIRPDISGVDDQALNDLGITRDQYEMLYGSPLDDLINQYRSGGLKSTQVGSVPAEYFRQLGDAGRFVTQRSADEAITRGNVASDDDYARLEALNALSDENNLFLNPTERAQAGTANMDLVDLDRSGYVSAAENALANAVKESYRLRNVNAQSSDSGSFVKKFGGSIASGGLMPKGSSFKDFTQTLRPGSDQFKHIVDPRTPIMLPGGGGGLGEFVRTPGQEIGPYDAFTQEVADRSAPDLRAPTEAELNELRSRVQ